MGEGGVRELSALLLLTAEHRQFNIALA
jgi:hypothetical protein